MPIKLKKPLVVFDIETTGLSIIHDRIISISILRVEPNQKEQMKTYVVNPGIPIPSATTQIHGFTDDDVKDKPAFKEVAAAVAKLFEGADIAGFNSTRFDLPFLAEELVRAGLDVDFKKHNLIDVQVIYHKKEPRDLSAALRFYCGREMTDHHRSEADTQATWDVLQAQMEHYEDLRSIEDVCRFASHNRNADLAGHIIYNEANVEVFNFGKYKGQPVTEVFQKDSGYYGWVLKGDFPEYTKKVLTQIKLRNRI